MHIKTSTIIYGYNDNIILDESTILIEPRKKFIDIIKQKYKHKINLITKALVKTNNILKEKHLHTSPSNEYYIEQDNQTEYSSSYNKQISSKELVYTTSLESIIHQYKIQNINKLIININIDNCNDIIESIHSSNHILSNVLIHKDILKFQKENCSILNNFKIVIDELNPNYTMFTHKNLNVEIPKIAIFLTTEIPHKELDKFSLFIQQYQLNLIINDEYIPYPLSLNSIKNLQYNNNNKSKMFHEIIVENLDKIFNSQENFSENIDILIQFNPKFLNDKSTLQILYPLKDNILYINKVFDIIYSTKNCMYMLYQIINSKYFTDYLDEKKKEKPSLFKIFSKRYFYDYISKIFTVKEV